VREPGDSDGVAGGFLRIEMLRLGRRR
jgi:hypothetical protein